MSDAVNINSNIARDLITSIRELKAEISSLKKILKGSVYGSEEWWAEEIRKGEDDITSGNYKSYKNAKSLIADLHKSI